MTRIMYDGINSLAAGIHNRFPGTEMVAGYIDGNYAWTQAEWNLFPHAVKVQVTVSSSVNAGDVIDCETGDATPAEAAAWVRKRRAVGYYRPTIYCSRSVIPAVRQATGNLVLGRDYDIWVADYTGTPHQVTAPGTPAALCVATQYLNTAGYDESTVYDDGWPHRTAPKPPAQPKPPVQPAQQPQPQEEQDMAIEIPPGATTPDVGVSFNGSPYSSIGFLADPSRVGATSVEVRCAFHKGATAGFTVATATMTAAEPKAVVQVPDGCDGVSFRRLDNAGITLYPNFA
jgi:hypothetical protein